MQLFDTATKKVVPFKPDKIVEIYTCGITPYDATHLGHAATYLTYDILQRRLRSLGHETRCVRNVTDIDDDILKKARELGVYYLDLAASTMRQFSSDMKSLNMLGCWSEPRATSAISDIRGFIGIVIDGGYAYEVNGAVYFDISKYKGFGEFSGFSENKMIELARENGGDPDDPNKHHPIDFVLWRPSGEDEPKWGSLWGEGRPGWHIECSALAMRELSPSIDLHGGGSDLIFPHHECERAQSEAVTGEIFSKHWMHQQLVEMDGKKMSKSLGNMIFISDLLKEYDARAIRLMIISHHYRKNWSYLASELEESTEKLNRWIGAGEGEATLDKVGMALDADLNVPEAVEAIDQAAQKGLGVKEAATLLGIDI